MDWTNDFYNNTLIIYLFQSWDHNQWKDERNINGGGWKTDAYFQATMVFNSYITQSESIY